MAGKVEKIEPVHAINRLAIDRSINNELERIIIKVNELVDKVNRRENNVK